MPNTGPKIIKLNPYKAKLSEIKEVIKILNNGGIALVPTDTVYGIAASIKFSDSIERIYKIKKRQKEKPLPILIASWQDASKIAGRVTQRIRLWMKEYWPGPITFILHDRAGKKVGLRVPDMPVTLKILKNCGPLATTSANISGKGSVRSFDKINNKIISSVDIAINAGTCPLGKDSTVVDISGSKPVILRQGGGFFPFEFE